jgi:hypothetical protein
MLTEHKDSIEALRDGRTNKSSPRFSASDQPDYLGDRSTSFSHEGYNNERQKT